jgi:nitrite reductase/ring-hydroxylating ferredoxin subunit
VTEPDLTRRRALAGAVAGGLSLPVLAACGGGSTSTTQQPPADGGSSPQPSGGPDSGGGSNATALVATANVPVGGGVVLTDRNVVVTQPTSGTFEGFSATCTHAGCQLASVSDGTINCPCHGSQFSITDGANVTGPSGSPGGSVPGLGRVPVEVQGKEVVEA